MASFSVQYIFDFATRNMSSMTAAAQAAKGLTGAMNGAGAALMGFGRAAAQALLAAGAVEGVFKLAQSSIEKAAKFEEKMAEVRKVVPDMTKQMMWDLGDEVLALSAKTAVSAEHVADIFASGARMGIRGKEALSGFAETVVKVAAAWDGVSASMAAENLATISGKFFNDLAPVDAQKRMKGVADAINYLAQNTAGVKNAELLKFFQNSGPMAAQMKLTAEETAAWGAVAMMSGKSGGLEEGTRASMSMQRMMLAATKKMTGKKGLTDAGRAFKQLGMTPESWGAMVQSGPQDAVLHLMEKMQGMDNLAKTKFLKDFLGDARAARQLTAMSGQLNEYKRALAQVSDKYAQRFLKEKAFMDWMDKAYPAQAKLLREQGKALHEGSVDQEFQARMDTLTKQWERLKNAMYGLQVQMGKPFLEPFKAGIESITEWIDRNPGFAKNIAFGGIATALAAVGAAALGVTAKLMGVQGAMAALRAIGAVALRLTLYAAGIAAVMWIYDNWEKMKAAFADPLSIKINFPEMPDWLQWIIKDGMKANRAIQDQFDDDRSFYQRFQDWRSGTPNDGRYKPGADMGDPRGYRAETIPQSVSVTTKVDATFAPAEIRVNGTVDASGLVRLQGSGPTQASSRGQSSSEVGGSNSSHHSGME